MAKYSRKRTKNVRSNRRSRKVSRKNYSRKRRITKKNKRRVSKKRTLRGGILRLSKKEKINKEIKGIFEREKYLFNEDIIANNGIERYNSINSVIEKKMKENNLSVNDLNDRNKYYLNSLKKIISNKEVEQKKLEEEAKIKKNMEDSIREYIKTTDPPTPLWLALSNAINNPDKNSSASKLYDYILDNVNDENALTNDNFSLFQNFGNLPNINNGNAIAEQKYKDEIKKIYAIYKSINSKSEL